MDEKQALAPAKPLENLILTIRGQRIMMDADLAMIYGVTTKRLNEQVKRNRERFPSDFMFQLTPEEKREVVANCDHLANLKFSPNLPYAFTEHGAIMAANVLNSKRAIEMSVYVVRAFVRIREILSTHKQLALKVAELEQKLTTHDHQILEIIQVIKEMMSLPPAKPKSIGFTADKKRGSKQ